MEVALGVLKWSPGEFWRSTPHELAAAQSGFQKSNGNGEADFMKPDELTALMEEFPD